MALTLLEEVNQFRVRHRPSESLRLRIGIHRYAGRARGWETSFCIYISYFSACMQWSRLRRRGGEEDAQVLPVWGHRQHRIQDGVHRDAAKVR